MPVWRPAQRFDSRSRSARCGFFRATKHPGAAAATALVTRHQATIARCHFCRRISNSRRCSSQSCQRNAALASGVAAGYFRRAVRSMLRQAEAAARRMNPFVMNRRREVEQPVGRQMCAKTGETQ